MTGSQELTCLLTARAALSALPPDFNASMRAALRAVDRAADDAEVAAEEAQGDCRVELVRAVGEARAAAIAVRTAAKGKARENVRMGRRTLLFDGVGKTEENADEASKVAEDITAGLRRVTGIVQEELDRTQATGNLVDDSSRRLKQVRDVHRGYGSHLESGADTLHILKQQERNANIFLAFCFLSFFLVAFYVSQRRVRSSNTATYIVNPAIRALTFPLRLLRALVRSLSGGKGRGGASSTPNRPARPVVGSDSPPSARENKADQVAVESPKSLGLESERYMRDGESSTATQEDKDDSFEFIGRVPSEQGIDAAGEIGNGAGLQNSHENRDQDVAGSEGGVRPDLSEIDGSSTSNSETPTAANSKPGASRASIGTSEHEEL